MFFHLSLSGGWSGTKPLPSDWVRRGECKESSPSRLVRRVQRKPSPPSRLAGLTLDGQPAAGPALGLAGEQLAQADADDVLLQGELQRVEAQQLQPQLPQGHALPRPRQRQRRLSDRGRGAMRDSRDAAPSPPSPTEPSLPQR